MLFNPGFNILLQTFKHFCNTIITFGPLQLSKITLIKITIHSPEHRLHCTFHTVNLCYHTCLSNLKHTDKVVTCLGNSLANYCNIYRTCTYYTKLIPTLMSWSVLIYHNLAGEHNLDWNQDSEFNTFYIYSKLYVTYSILL